MNTYRVYAGDTFCLAFDLGELTLDQCEHLFNQYDLNYTAYRIDEQGAYYSDLDQEFTSKIDLIFSQRTTKLNPDDDNYAELSGVSWLWDNHDIYYRWVEPFWLFRDCSPFRLLLDYHDNDDGTVVIPGFFKHHLYYSELLNNCYTQGPILLENMKDLIHENLYPVNCSITNDMEWTNEAGNIIQVLKHHDRYFILNGFSIFINHLRMNKTSIMAQLVEI